MYESSVIPDREQTAEELAKEWESVAKERGTTLCYLGMVALLFLVLWVMAANSAAKYARLETSLRGQLTLRYEGMCKIRAERGEISLAERNLCIRDAKLRANEEVDDLLK